MRSRMLGSPRSRITWFIGSCLILTVAAIDAVAQTPTVDFAPLVTYELPGNEVRDMVVVDIDQDGDQDLVCAMASGEMGVALNDGQGAFSDVRDIHINIGAWGIGSGDFNGDGFPDIAVTEGYSSGSRVLIYLGSPSQPGQLTLGATLAAGWFPIDAVSGDFDEDGWLDLAVANNVSYGVTILRGLGDGTFETGVHLPGWTSLHATDLALGDLDADGHLDLVVAHYNGVRVFFGAGDGTFPATAAAGTSNLTEGVAVGDFDLDGLLDVTSVEIYADQMRISLNSGARTFFNTHSYPASSFSRDVAVSDLNLDGVPDVVVAAESSDKALVYLGHGDGSFLVSTSFPPGDQPRTVGIADWNGDGWPDLALALRNRGDTPSLSVLRNQSPIEPWQLLGLGLKSASGLPLLEGQGTPRASSPIAVDLDNARASASAVLVAGFSRIDLPFLGGTMVPALDAVFTGLTTTPSGTFHLPYTLPANLPPGLALYTQMWILDPTGPQGFAASNGLSATTQ